MRPGLFGPCLSMLLILSVLPSCAPQEPVPAETPEKPVLRTGADQFFDEPYYSSWFKGKGIGLVTNQTGVNSGLKNLPDLLGGSDEIRLVALFGPEHGLYGEAEAGDDVAERPNIYNLYGEHQAPTPEMLEGVEVLVYDIQDVGSRFYTFISTMYECMKAVSGTGISFVILDRPNPIGGSRVEGPILEEGYESFVGTYAIPIRYGMTAGELAMLLKGETGLELDLKVLPVKGWSRDQDFSAYGGDWINPSPNMPGYKTALVYPGFCLIEGTSLSEGRGTTRPFEYLGAPWIDSRTLAGRLNGLNLPGVWFRPQMFTPSFSKHQGEACGGVQVHVTDAEVFQPVLSALYFIETVKEMYPDQFSFSEDSFDRLCGNSWVREMLQEGAEADAVAVKWEKNLEAFRKIRENYLLY